MYTKFIASKAQTGSEVARADSDESNINPHNDEIQKGVTGFYRDVETGNLILKAYQVKGFFKEAAKALKSQLSLASSTSKIDNFVFIEESDIPLMREGSWLENPDGYLDRPLRAETAQGPRVGLAKSELVKEDWTLEFTIKVIENKGTAKSVALDMDIVKHMLDYCSLKGLLQWRNAGYGSFDWEILDDFSNI